MTDITHIMIDGKEVPVSEFYKPRKKVLILGHGRHGKDTAADILKEELDYQFISSSLFAAKRVMMPYFAKMGVHYASVEACYEDRHAVYWADWAPRRWLLRLLGIEPRKVEHRAIWYDQISAYNSPDKARLAREIMQECDIYVGMRSNEEYQAAKGLFDVTLWVDAGLRVDYREPRNSFDIDFNLSEMIWIDNNGSLEHLKRQVLAAVR